MSTDRDADDACDATLATYEANTALYIAKTPTHAAHTTRLLTRLAGLVPGGHVLELGTGPGWAADLLETLGLTVDRTDATVAFVQLLREAGHGARVLDARAPDYGGPYDAVLALAVLLHLDHARCEEALATALRTTRPGGVLALTLKEGDGDEWTTVKLDAPCHMTYWREGPLLEALRRAGWAVESLDHVADRPHDWLFVIARRPDDAS